ncbi:hypothetical protein ACFE04_018161 [Oxalis oulophora]
MALFASSRLSSKSKQLYGCSQVVLRQDQLRSYANVAPPSTPPKALKGDEMLRNIFLEVKNKFETAVAFFRKEKITIDPEDPAAVSHYAKLMKQVRQKAGFFSESERIKNDIQQETQDIQDARSYLLKLKELRVECGINDDLGAETMMMAALDKIETETKKPLMRNDKKGMALLTAEFDKINNNTSVFANEITSEAFLPGTLISLEPSAPFVISEPVRVWAALLSCVTMSLIKLLPNRLGIKKEELAKYEEQLDMNIAKAELQEMKKEAVEAMESQKKRDEFKDEAMPDVKSLDIRNFL